MNMTEAEVLERLQRLAVDVLALALPPGERAALTRLDEVTGLDSLSAVELVVAVEREFGIRLDAAAIDRSVIADLPALAARIVATLRSRPC